MVFSVKQDGDQPTSKKATSQAASALTVLYPDKIRVITVFFPVKLHALENFKELFDD